VVWAWGRVISELVGSDNPCINGQNILATEVVEYMSARGVPVVRVWVKSLGRVWSVCGMKGQYDHKSERPPG
jgi:hypothetical protein